MITRKGRCEHKINFSKENNITRGGGGVDKFYISDFNKKSQLHPFLEKEERRGTKCYFVTVQHISKLLWLLNIDLDLDTITLPTHFAGSSGFMALREETELRDLLPWCLVMFLHSSPTDVLFVFLLLLWKSATPFFTSGLLSSLLFSNTQNVSCPVKVCIYAWNDV